MSVTIEPAGLAHASYVAAYLRHRDVVEAQAVFGTSQDIPTIVAAVVTSSPHSYVAMVNDNPVLVFGVATNALMPQLGVAWGYGTQYAWRAIPTAGRYIREFLIPQLLDAGVHRVEVRVLADNVASIKWLTRYMGAHHETSLKDFGVQRQQFEQYAWLRSDFENV